MKIQKIREQLPKEVKLLAATKKRSVDEILPIIDYVDAIGENYIQEAKEKYPLLKGKVDIHCIGHIQSNKAKDAVEIFDMIQSIDSLKIAKEINKQCVKKEKVMPVLIEVNSAQEENKTGCKPEEVATLAEAISQLDNLKLKGLMTMGSVGDLKGSFQLTKKLFDKLKEKYTFSVLSMGMSDSYELAIEQGSTMVRLGTILFGPR